MTSHGSSSAVSTLPGCRSVGSSAERSALAAGIGTSSIAITGDVYGHVAPDVSREAVDILGDVLGT